MRGDTAQMHLDILSQYSQQVKAMMEATTSSDVQEALDRLVEDEQWDLLSHLLPTATELAARRTVDQLLKHNQYGPLAWAACLRRQPRRPGLEAATTVPSRPILRDFEAEEDTEGVPEHIMAEAQEMSDTAAQRREVSRRKAAQVDHDPIRDLIIRQLADRLPQSDAGQALLTIAKACPFAHTQREAAMKLANHKQWMQQLARARRTSDMIAISNAARLQAVAQNIAQAMSQDMAQLQQDSDEAAIGFIAENHPDREMRQAAHAALS